MSWVQSVTLERFRNYLTAQLAVDECAPVVLTGSNGAGKTSFLEALSFLSVGKGLHGHTLQDIAYNGTGSWSIFSHVIWDNNHHTLATGYTPEERRITKLDGEKIATHTLGHKLPIVAYTPSMNRVLSGSQSLRRQFLDKLVSKFTPQHSARLYRYDKALKEWSHLVHEQKRHDTWLSALEDTLVNEGSAITAARLEYLHILNDYLSKHPTPFPTPILSLEGSMEMHCQKSAALDAETAYADHLKKSRHIPPSTEFIPPHKSLLRVFAVDSHRPAELCSTGEQKALLLSVILANCRVLHKLNAEQPVLLLDEVTVHLDAQRVEFLFDEICYVGAQAWMTGTHPNSFSRLAQTAYFFNIDNGAIYDQQRL